MNGNSASGPDIWEIGIEFVLRMEGGPTAENDPRDPGGLTKFGISKKAYPNLDISNLTQEQAKAIYRRDYWDACRCGDLPPQFALAVFDTAVNQGVGTAKRLLQVAIDVEVDGVIGPRTISAAYKASQRRLMKFFALRMAEYARLMSRNPNLLVFAVNWNFRVLSLFDLVRPMMAVA